MLGIIIGIISIISLTVVTIIVVYKYNTKFSNITDSINTRNNDLKDYKLTMSEYISTRDIISKQASIDKIHSDKATIKTVTSENVFTDSINSKTGNIDSINSKTGNIGSMYSQNTKTDNTNSVYVKSDLTKTGVLSSDKLITNNAIINDADIGRLNSLNMNLSGSLSFAGVDKATLQNTSNGLDLTAPGGFNILDSKNNRMTSIGSDYMVSSNMVALEGMGVFGKHGSDNGLYIIKDWFDYIALSANTSNDAGLYSTMPINVSVNNSNALQITNKADVNILGNLNIEKNNITFGEQLSLKNNNGVLNLTDLKTQNNLLSLSENNVVIGSKANSINIGVNNFVTNNGDAFVRPSIAKKNVYIGDTLTENVILGDKSTNVNVLGNLNLNNNPLQFGSSSSNGIGYFDKDNTYGGYAPDGPILYGNSGGGLGTLSSGPMTALKWDNLGAVTTNDIKVTNAWSGFTDTSKNTSEISNDTNRFKQLMIVGNKSAGGVRQVGVWDKLNVHGDLRVSNRICAGNECVVKKDVAKIKNIPLIESNITKLQQTVLTLQNQLNGRLVS